MLCKHCECEITERDIGYGKIDECRDCATEVEKYAGHMVWDHKTAPSLEVHASQKSLSVLKNGKYNEGLSLRHSVRDRSRRRESDISTDPISLSPYVRREEFSIESHSSEDLPKIEIRHGSGKTIATFSRTSLEKSKTDAMSFSHLSGEKLLIFKSVARQNLSNIAGISITVWKDQMGYYLIPRKQFSSSKLDFETIRRLGHRTSNFSPK